MFNNYFKVAFRNLIRNRMYSLIIVSGLALGLACSILISLYVRHELSYDRFHGNAERICRVVTEVSFEGKREVTAVTSPPVGPAMAGEFPDVLGFVRFYQSHPETVLLSHGDGSFYESRFFLADAGVFDIFSFPLIKGDPRTALKEPFSLVITEEMAEKYFGAADPLGKVLKYRNTMDFVITGVMKNVPPNSHLHFDFLASFSTMTRAEFESLDDWGSCCLYTYLLLRGPGSEREVEKGISAFVRRHMSGDFFIKNFQIQPLTGIHLRSHLSSEVETNSDLDTIRIFLAFALVVLFIAGINFVNLSTARHQSRAREVGLRKVLGAERRQIIRQYLSESIFITFLALPLAIMAVRVFLPLFNIFSGKNLQMDDIFQLTSLATIAAVALVTALAAGLYPAFYLSALPPVKSLKGGSLSGAGRAGLRNILVLAQFAIAVLLIASTLVINRQLHFMRGKNLGFDKENVVVIPLKERAIRQKWQAIKEELLRHPAVLKIAASSDAPGGADINSNPFRLEGLDNNKGMVLSNIRVDYDFLDTLGMEIKEGRTFSRELATDASSAFIINEAAAKKIGWLHPLGKTLEWRPGGDRSKKGTIIGVVKDFHFMSLRLAIEPMVLHIAPEYFDTLLVRIRGDIPGTLAFLKQKWTEFAPHFPFDCSFLDDDFDAFYKAEEKLGSIFLYFTFLAIFIACLGLFGLAAYTTERRTREIGIRKVMGASIPQIVFLLNKEFGKWVLAANLIAWPLSIYALNRWLENFAYRIHIGLGIFFLSGLLTLLIALLTVAFQSLRAARANPVESIRYE